MTAQETIKKFMAALTNQNYSSAKNSLDEAVRKSSRFNGIQDAISNFLEDQKTVERNAIKEILGVNYKTDYDGKQLSDLLEMAETDTELAAVLNAEDAYPYDTESYGRMTFSAAERIRMLTANKFLSDYCGITLDKYFFHNSSGSVTYYSNFTTGNVDTGAITGSDAGGSNIEKTAENVVPEIGNKYTATATTPQIITTGSNDWIVSGTSAGDTIYSSGTDSIDAGAGADIIYVSGNNSTISGGANDTYADTVNIGSEVKTVTVIDLESFDTLNIDGNFEVAAAKLNSETDAVTITDSTGKRTFIINGWTDAQNSNVKVNGKTQKLGAWLSDFVDYTASSETATATTTAEITNSTIVNLDDVTDVGGSFSLLTTSREASYDATLESGTTGNVSSEFPNVTTFTTHGLTVELWGSATDSEASTVTALTLDTMTAAQKNIFAGLYKWWVKESLNLNEESFGLSFDSGKAEGSNIKVFFYSDNSATLAFVRNHGSGKNLELGINMSHYDKITATDVNGSGNSYLDRTIAHEFTHAIMAATVDNFNSLPQFINEGLAELVHGIDDERGYRIWELAGADTSTSRISSALSLTDTSTGSSDAYAGGYLFLRYFAKQAASDTSNSIALGDATVSVSLTGANETYYANLNSASSIERAVNTASSSNFSVGTAKDRTYTVAAGINQQIYTTDEDWTIRDIGQNNTLIAGGGNDYVTISGANNFVSLGDGENRVSLSAGLQNTVVTGNSSDSIRVGTSNSTILTGAGNDSITFASYSGSTVNSSNYIDSGDGSDYISVYNVNQSILAGADDDTVHIRGNFISVDGGSGNDDINIYTPYNTVTGGAGTDRYVIQSSSIEALTITDFSIPDREYIYLTKAVNSAYYDSTKDAVVLGGVNLYLENADNINDFLSMNIFNQSTMTTLKDLMGAKIFDWYTDGDYFFLIEDDSVTVSSDALTYDRHYLNKNYAKVSINGNSISVITDAPSKIEFNTPSDNPFSLTIDNNYYIFTGDAVFLGSYAYTGDYILAGGMYFFDGSDDKIKYMQYTGATETDFVNVTLGDTMSIYLDANETVSLTYDNYTEIYTATSSTMTKEAAFVTLNDTATEALAEDITTYRGYNFKFGSDVFKTDFTEINHYYNDYQNYTTLLYSGTLELEGNTFTIETVFEDSGITLLYDSNGENLEGINNFTEGEKITINDGTYTVTNGRIIRTSDGEYYNGDWNYFIANMNEDYYWGAITGWKIENEQVIYILKDEPVLTINGLNLDGVEAVDGEIAGVTLDENNYVTLAENLIGSDEVTFDGTGYLIKYTKNYSTSIIGTDLADYITPVDEMEPENQNWIIGNGGNDTISANHLTVEKYTVINGGADDDSISVKDSNISSVGGFGIYGDAGNDEILADNISVGGQNQKDGVAVSGGSFNIGGGDGVDNISVSNITIDNKGTFNIYGDDSVYQYENNDTISISNIAVDNGYSGVWGNYGDDSISAENVTVSGSNFTISGGEGADEISLSSVTLTEGNIGIWGDNGDDSISVNNVTISDGEFIIYGDSKSEESTSGGNDLISVTDSSGIQIISGNGNDTLTFSGNVQAAVNDFSADDTIYLKNAVTQAQFRNGVLTLGTVSLTLNNISDIYSFGNLKVMNGNEETSLGSLLANGFEWIVEDGVATYGNLITVEGLSENASADDLSLSGTIVTISDHALDYSNTVTISDGYTLALADDVTKSEITSAEWIVENSTAHYIAAGQTSGYSLVDNEIFYTAASSSTTLILVEGLSENASADDLTVSDTIVTISENALDSSKTVTISDGYTLKLADDVDVPTATETDWAISNGTAHYNAAGMTGGFIVSDNEISYQAASDVVTLITVTGLSENATSKDLVVSDSTVTVSENALGTGSVVVTEGYTLKLADDVTTPQSFSTSWSVTRGTATYKAAHTTAGYVLTNNSIVYQAEKEGATLATVTGLSPAATVNDISLSGTTVTVAANSLSKSEVEISDGYTLRLGSDVAIPAATSNSWRLSDEGVATYHAPGLSEGYVILNNIITYQDEIIGDTLITVSGLSENATLEDISLSDTVVTIAANALSQENVTVSNGYTFALADNVPVPTETSTSWEIADGTAIYRSEGLTDGYIISENQIVYQNETPGEVLITVTGLNSDTTVEDISLEGRTVTISAAALTENNVTISSGYSLALAEDVVTPEATETIWELENGIATYTGSGLTEGYTLSNRQIIYHEAADGETLFTITGLSENATLEDISLSGNTVTISNNALAAANTVSITSGYTLELADDVTTPASVTAGWTIEEGTATYNTSGQTAGYIISNNRISYKADTYTKDLITINGVSENATAADIALAGKKVTIHINALAHDTVTITKGYTFKLASDVPVSNVTSEGWYVSGGVANYNTAGQTEGYILSNNIITYNEEIAYETKVTVTGLKISATASGLSLNGNTVTISNGIVNRGAVTVSDGYALVLSKGTYSAGTSIVGGAGADTITNNGTGLIISGGAGNDSVSLASGVSKNTIVGGAGDDTISAAKGKNMYLYANGDGNDVINGFTENDSLRITSGSISGWTTEGKDVIFTVGEGSVRLVDAVGKKITTINSSKKVTTQIYNEGFIYDEDKKLLTLSSTFSDTLNSSAYVNTIVTIDGTAADSSYINGNSKANKITGGSGADSINGGSGADTLTGGSGADVFVYANGGGKDVITDYTTEDSVFISNGSIDSASIKSSDVIFKVGAGTLTVKNGKSKQITTINSTGATSTNIYESGATYNADKTAVTYTSSFKGTLESGIVTADASSLSSAVKIIGNSANNSIIGTAKADTLGGGTGNDTLTGGNGKDVLIYNGGNDLITDYAAGDKISLASSISGFSLKDSDLILETAAGNITVEGGAEQAVTTVFNRKTETSIYYDGLVYNAKQTAVTLDTNFEGAYSAANISTVVTIDGAAADSVSITGNAKANKIYGGSGDDTLFGGGNKNDTLTGGDGKDVFVYASNGGKDVIADFTTEDSIYISSGTISSISATSSDVTFKVGSGTLTVKKGAGKAITLTDSSGETSTQIYEKGKIYNEDKTEVTFTASFKGTLESGVLSADASALSSAVKIFGNSADNVIYGGTKADSLGGGAGNDTLTGGGGNDTFIFEQGNDLITDYAAGDKIKFSGEFNWSIEGDDVIFETGKGSITVADGVGKEISTVVNGKTTKQKYTASSTNARISDLFDDNNFISNGAQISDITKITEDNYSAGKIETQNFDSLAQDKDILAYSKDK